MSNIPSDFALLVIASIRTKVNYAEESEKIIVNEANFEKLRMELSNAGKVLTIKDEPGPSNIAFPVQPAPIRPRHL